MDAVSEFGLAGSRHPLSKRCSHMQRISQGVGIFRFDKAINGHEEVGVNRYILRILRVDWNTERRKRTDQAVANRQLMNAFVDWEFLHLINAY